MPLFEDSITTYSQNTSFTNDFTALGKCTVLDKLNIYNFEQTESNDFVLKVDKIFNGIPLEIFNSNYIYIGDTVSVNTSVKDRTSIVNTNGGLVINNLLNLTDSERICNYVINNDLISNGDLNMNNTDRYLILKYDMIIDGNETHSLYLNDNFIIQNELNCRENINIRNNLDVNLLEYVNTNIDNNINITGNFNTFSNFNISSFLFNRNINTDNLIVLDSIYIQNNANFYLPNLTFTPNTNGQLRYNKFTKNIEAFTNNWIPLNKNQNSTKDSEIIQRNYNIPNVGNNIEFIQNNNLVVEFNNNSDILNIFHNNVNIHNDVFLHQNVNINENILIKNNALIQNDFIINPGKSLTIYSNSNLPVEPGSIRMHSKLNLYQLFIDKWYPLQHILNSYNTSNVNLFYEDDLENYDTIIFNSNSNHILKIKPETTNIDTNLLNIIGNLNINNDLLLDSEINSNKLYLNENVFLYKNSNDLIYSSINGINYKIITEELEIDQISLEYNSYMFYVYNANSIYKRGCIINNFIKKSDAILDYAIDLTEYKIHNIENNQIFINSIAILANQTITGNITVKINNIDNEYIINFNEENTQVIHDINLSITNYETLYVEIKINNIIDDNLFKVIIYTKYDLPKGIINKEFSEFYIDQSNIFENTTKNFIGNVNIKDNIFLNLNTSNINNLILNNTVGVGTTNSNLNFEVKNKNNTVFTVNNNTIGIGTNNSNYPLLVYSNINSTSLNSGSIIIDKNLNVSNNLKVYGNIETYDNLNINNILYNNITNNVITDTLFVKNNISFKNNIAFYGNIDVQNNVNISKNLHFSNYVLIDDIENNSSCIRYKDNIVQTYIEEDWKPINIFNTEESNCINLEDSDNVNYTYNNKSLMQIEKNKILLNSETYDNDTIFNISNNFNFSDNKIESKSDTFIVNNIDIAKELTYIESKYYCPSILKNKSSIALSNDAVNFNIYFNRPALYQNLNTYNTYSPKYIKEFGYQLCVNDTVDNWNTNSLVYYKKVDELNLNNAQMEYNQNFTIPINNKDEYINSVVTFNDIRNKNLQVFNLNVGNDRTQFIYNLNGTPIFNNPINNNLLLRIFPVYNIEDESLLYNSEIVDLTINNN